MREKWLETHCALLRGTQSVVLRALSNEYRPLKLITSSRRLWDDQGEPTRDPLCISVLDGLQKDVDSLLGPFESESVNSNPVEEGYSDSTEAKE